MTRALVIVCVFCAFLVSCTEKVICPAYQSAYIYDKEALRKKFSYFQEDSTPKIYAANKNRYLIGERVPYKKKVRSLQTVQMKPVLPVVPDSLKDNNLDAEMDSVNRNVNDSTAVLRIDTLGTDSVYVISKDREVRVLKTTYVDSVAYDSASGKYRRVHVDGVPVKPKYHVKEVGFNVEQDNYMWYLRDILVLPDVRLAKQKQEANKKEAQKAEKKKKGLKGFFSRLFKKKDKSNLAQDSVQNIKSEEDYGYDDFEGKPRDTTAVDQAAQPKPEPKKKGIFSFLKKDKKKSDKKEPDPAKKEEEGKDEGF